MSYEYSQKKHTGGSAKSGIVSAEPSFDALRSGAAVPTAEQMGSRVDLPDAMREKMESAFGADLSSVRLYQSEAVRDAGVKAVAQGSNIAFAPGVLDFTSYGGQAILGHEISHVVSQMRGEVTGSGLLNDPALEARADREGAMAAAGQQISVPTEALSPVTAAPAAGPMQCLGKNKAEYEPFMKIDPGKAGKVNAKKSAYDLSSENHDRDAKFNRRKMKKLDEEVIRRFTDDEYDLTGLDAISNGADVKLTGLSLRRMTSELKRSLGEGYSMDEILSMYDDLMAPHRKGLAPNTREYDEAQSNFDRGIGKLKEMQYRKLKRMEATFGILPSQMHPRDFMQLVGDQYNDYFHTTQDSEQLMRGGAKYFDFNDDRDRDFKALHEYYLVMSGRNSVYGSDERQDAAGSLRMNPDFTDAAFKDPSPFAVTPQMEAAVHGPSLSPQQQTAYLTRLHNRFQKAGWTNRLFGRFRKFDDPKRTSI